MVGKVKVLLLSVIIIPAGFQIIAPKRTISHHQETIRFWYHQEQLAINLQVDGPPNVESAFPALEAGLLVPVRRVLPASYDMVNQAIRVLSKGWAGMSQQERDQFRLFFDPGHSQEIDEQFVLEVLENYRKIKHDYETGVTLQLEINSEYCLGKRLYYTYWSYVHVCPYFSVEEDIRRQARDFLHEYVHISLNVEDRAYYHPESEEFAGLTPRGETLNELPLIGYLFGELTLSDTLKNPDSYAWFADVVSQPA